MRPTVSQKYSVGFLIEDYERYFFRQLLADNGLWAVHSNVSVCDLYLISRSLGARKEKVQAVLGKFLLHSELELLPQYTHQDGCEHNTSSYLTEVLFVDWFPGWATTSNISGSFFFFFFFLGGGGKRGGDCLNEIF